MVLSLTFYIIKSSYKKLYRDFPRGAVLTNLPANAVDMGSSPNLGRSHVPQSN